MTRDSAGRRPPSFWILTGVFVLFVLFLYGPMSAIYILSFQGPTGGLTFPMRGVSLHWFGALFGQQRTGDFSGSFIRSIVLALLAMGLTLAISLSAGLAFRQRFRGATAIFYAAIASLVMPGLFVGLGIALVCQVLGITPRWWMTALGAHLTWTLPFGLLIMFAVFNRFDRAYEEAARDLGATDRQVLTAVILPILAPGLIAVALFGFTLSYDEVARSTLTVGARNTMPLEIFAMTNNVTSPALFALGTVTTAISFLAIAIALFTIARITRRRGTAPGAAGAPP
jgi:putative spermidine/putrescine transport system permease protein